MVPMLFVVVTVSWPFKLAFRLPEASEKVIGEVPPDAEVKVQELARPVVVYRVVTVSCKEIGTLTVTRTATVAVSPTESVTVTVSL